MWPNASMMHFLLKGRLSRQPTGVAEPAVALLSDDDVIEQLDCEGFAGLGNEFS